MTKVMYSDHYIPMIQKAANTTLPRFVHLPSFLNFCHHSLIIGSKHTTSTTKIMPDPLYYHLSRPWATKIKATKKVKPKHLTMSTQSYIRCLPTKQELLPTALLHVSKSPFFSKNPWLVVSCAPFCESGSRG
jgi:hypothetical protein